MVVGDLPGHKYVYLDYRIVYKGRFKKCNLIQSAENDVTKRANLSKIGTFKPFISLVQTC